MLKELNQCLKNHSTFSVDVYVWTLQYNKGEVIEAVATELQKHTGTHTTML